jgi:hypothetical protein
VRAAAVALVYGVARSAAHQVAVVFGARPLDEPIGAFALEFGAGIVVGLLLGAVARVLGGTWRRRLVALTTLIFLSLLAVMIEGAAFAPELQPPAALPSAAVMQLAVAILTALAITSLFAATPQSAKLPELPRRTRWSWLWRYGASAMSYVVLYFATGAVSYTLMTGPYYEAHVSGLVVPAPAVVLGVAVLEGALFPLAVLPLLYALPSSRRKRAIIAGAVLFVLGGLIPLLISSSMPIELRAASLAEILFQKFPAGVVTALLLGPRQLATRLNVLGLLNAERT